MQKIRWTRLSIEWSNFFKSKKFSKLSSRFGGAIALILAASLIASPAVATAEHQQKATTGAGAITAATKATSALGKLAVKGRAPKTGYARELFSDGWGDIGSCDLRNYVLARDLSSVAWRAGEKCMVETGVLLDPYTGKKIYFKRGVSTSIKVQIDHVIAVSDAWQKGAQQLSSSSRYKFYNDPLNLLAVDGPTNSSKGDSDAASWLPPNKSYRCAYVARQIAVKAKYKLWVTSAEKSAMAQVLSVCPSTLIPTK
jgi:hypothetical protein